MRKKTAEELRRLMELRRSNAASSVPSKKVYNRKKMSDPNAIIKERK
jgi:hypothetical protein